MQDIGDRNTADVQREHREILTKHSAEIAENRHGLNNQKQIVGIHLANIETSIAELKSILKWAGGLIITLMISFMGWALLQQYTANEAQKRDLQDQVNLLREQDRTSALLSEDSHSTPRPSN